MFEKDRYGKILVPIVTPFKEDQSVDYEALVSIGAELIHRRFADTLVLTGTTGEFFTMTFEERCKVFEIMKKELGGKIPLIAGTGSASTIEAIALTERAQDLGYQTVMVVAPYYTKPSGAEILNHFRRVAEAVNIDIMLYNIPIFTGVNIDPHTVSALAKLPNVVAIKEEAELNPKQMTSYLNATPDDFIVYCGDDTMVLEALAQGGERIGGFVSGGAHIVGDRLKAMIGDFLSGKILEAGTMQRSLLPLFRSMAQNGRSNPVCMLKGAMKLLGYRAGIPRLPLMPANEQEMAVVKEEMKRVGILG